MTQRGLASTKEKIDRLELPTGDGQVTKRTDRLKAELRTENYERGTPKGDEGRCTPLSQMAREPVCTLLADPWTS